MHNRPRMLAAASLLALAVAGCSGRDSSPGPTGGNTPTPPTAAFETRFGTSFASFFTASNTSDPRDPSASDVPALNATADPLDN